MTKDKNLNLNSVHENTFTPRLDGNQAALEGLRLHKQGKFHEARSFYLDAINQECDNKESVLANLGIALKQLKDYQSSEKAYKEILRINPNNLSANANLASLYLETRDYEQSIAIAQATLKIEPNHIETTINLGLGLAATKQLDKATEIFEKCIQLAPRMADGYIYLAETHVANGNIEAAKKILTKAINRVENNSKLNTLLGKIFSASQNYEEAIFYYQSALKYDPNNHILTGEITRLKFLIGMHESDDEGVNEELTDVLEDSRSEYLLQNNGSDHLLIIFSSNGRNEKATNNEPPSFNFKNYLSTSKNVDKLFIRDLDRQYYVRNLGTASNNINETLGLIRSIIAQKNYTKIIAIGSSSGGFAAILFANLLKLDKAIVFNPQTVLSEEKESIINDLHFTVSTCRELRKLDKDNTFYQKCLNLRNFIPFQCDVDIHYSSASANSIDKKYAEFIKHKKCKLIEHQSTTHLLALELKDLGKLKTIIFKPFKSKISTTSSQQKTPSKAKGFG